MYKIKIDYETGDSFGSNYTEQLLEVSWDNLNDARTALRHIEEHYKLYEKLDGCSFDDGINEVAKLAKLNTPWLVVAHQWGLFDEKGRFKFAAEEGTKGATKYIDPQQAKWCLKLPLSNGNTFQLHAFWTGYFETLYGAEIILPPEEDKNRFYV